GQQVCRAVRERNADIELRCDEAAKDRLLGTLLKIDPADDLVLISHIPSIVRDLAAGLGSNDIHPAQKVECWLAIGRRIDAGVCECSSERNRAAGMPTRPVRA